METNTLADLLLLLLGLSLLLYIFYIVGVGQTIVITHKDVPKQIRLGGKLVKSLPYIDSICSYAVSREMRNCPITRYIVIETEKDALDYLSAVDELSFSGDVSTLYADGIEMKTSINLVMLSYVVSSLLGEGFYDETWYNRMSIHAKFLKTGIERELGLNVTYEEISSIFFKIYSVAMPYKSDEGV